MMKTKAKGSNAERELIHKFWQSGFAAIRSAGSGSMKYPSPDILAAKKGNILAIECKITKNLNKYFEKREINELNQVSKQFSANPYIAIKFKGNDWFFIKTCYLVEKDKSYMIDVKLAKKLGISFDNLVHNSIS